jgi:hypothetical protein
VSNLHRFRLTDRMFFVWVNLNPVKKGLVKRPEDWRWSSYNNFVSDQAAVAACPIQIDYVRLLQGYRA